MPLKRRSRQGLFTRVGRDCKVANDFKHIGFWPVAGIDQTQRCADLTGMADDVTETEDVGDLWLTFWVSALLAGLAAFALLRFIGFAEWAVFGAVAAGLAVGWVVSRVRPARRFVSGLVQLIAFPWW